MYSESFRQSCLSEKIFTLPFFTELAVSKSITVFNIVNTPRTHSKIADTVLSLGEIIITEKQEEEKENVNDHQVSNLSHNQNDYC